MSKLYTTCANLTDALVIKLLELVLDVVVSFGSEHGQIKGK